jgi:putative glycosyltransferase (TIGR04348 family)
MVRRSPDGKREIADTSGAFGFIGIFPTKVHTGRSATLDSPALTKTDSLKTCLASKRVSLDNLECVPITRNPGCIAGVTQDDSASREYSELLALDMHVLIITPPRPSRHSGNNVTAFRWRRMLKELGHKVEVQSEYTNEPCDVLVVLHARRNAAVIRRYRHQHPASPMIVVLTGTDLYRDLERSRSARASLEFASRLLLLQLDGLSRLPRRLAHKSRVIYQSAVPPARRPDPLKQCFEVCVIGHLRAEKDPFRAAMAARRLPASSRIRVVHLGMAMEPTWQTRAQREMKVNPRYQWLGEMSRGRTQQRLARSRLLVMSSRIEGGANAVSEALAADVPVLASRISGNVGMLGADYPGYFPVGDTGALAELLVRAETEPIFYQSLCDHCRERAKLVDPARERRDWDNLLGEFLWEACGST